MRRPDVERKRMRGGNVSRRVEKGRLVADEEKRVERIPDTDIKSMKEPKGNRLEKRGNVG